MAVTIADIAARSGVGLGTVSRVLNGSALVSAKTRDKVMRAIGELNYVPNAAARGLSGGRTFNIAVMAPFFTRAAFVDRLRGIEAAIADSPYDMIVHNVETTARRDLCYRTVPDRRRVDGAIIVALPPTSEDLRHVANAGVPVVFVDIKDEACAGFDRIVIDDVRGGRIATEHLIALGHRRIGFLGDLPKSGFGFTAGLDRYSGYRAAMTGAGLPLRDDHHLDGVFGREVARELALRMLSLPERPSAIFASSDTQAIGVLEAARALALDVPGDLSLVGYDDIEFAEYLGLTTVRQRLFESGERSVAALLDRIADPVRPPRCDMLPIELIVRRTTAPPR